MIYHIIFIVIYSSSVLGNYYEILGVSRSATDIDIKTSYKKLARKWHPDKNRSPEANERFTKINEAYEALSNPEKRKEYDAFGSISNEPRDNGRHHGHFRSGGNFGNAYFDFGSNEQSESQFESTNYRHYKIDILPNSYTQPTLILLVSHFCFSCHHAMRLWGSIATQITESGIRVTISDVMADSHLREELRIHHVPTVVMIIDGQVRYLQSEINKENVIDFIRNSFPRDLVQFIHSEDELNYFHDSWHRDSRSRMVMTKPLDRPSFRYLSIAFKYRDKISAGFVHLDDNNKQLTKLSNAYNLRTNEETVMIFHDEKHYFSSNVVLPKSIYQKSQSRLTLSDIDSIVLSNHLLPFPRLLSQTIFDLACPPPSQKQRSFGFCVITVVHSKHKKNLSESDSWQYVRSLIGDRGNGKIMYLFGDIQYQFLQSLRLSEPSKGSIDSFMDQVILLWRQSYTSATSLFLSNPWQYSNIEMILHNWDLLSNFDKAVSILKTKNQIQNKVTDSDSLSELVDELAAPLWKKIGLRLLSYVTQIYVYLYDIFSEPFNLIIVVLGLALASYVYSTAKAVSAHLSFEDTDKDRTSQQSRSPIKTVPGSVVAEFSCDSYKSLLKEERPGRLICVILTTEDTSPEVLVLLQDSITRLKCNKRLLAMSLRLDEHINWLRTLLANIKNDDDHNSGLSSISSLSINRPFAYEGIVLALNVGRCYLSICPINLMHHHRRLGGGGGDGHMIPESRGGRPDDSVTTTIPTVTGRGETKTLYDRRRLSFDLDSSSSDSSTDCGNHDDNDDNASDHRGASIDVKSRFFDWLCQLMDGTCRRYYVSQWPPTI